MPSQFQADGSSSVRPSYTRAHRQRVEDKKLDSFQCRFKSSWAFLRPARCWSELTSHLNQLLWSFLRPAHCRSESWPHTTDGFDGLCAVQWLLIRVLVQHPKMLQMLQLQPPVLPTALQLLILELVMLQPVLPMLQLHYNTNSNNISFYSNNKGFRCKYLLPSRYRQLSTILRFGVTSLQITVSSLNKSQHG